MRVCLLAEYNTCTYIVINLQFLKLQQLQRPMCLKLTVAVGQFYTGQHDTYAQTITTLCAYQVPWRNCLESNAPKQLHHGWLPWVCVVAQLSQCHCLRPHSQKVLCGAVQVDSIVYKANTTSTGGDVTVSLLPTCAVLVPVRTHLNMETGLAVGMPCSWYRLCRACGA